MFFLQMYFFWTCFLLFSSVSNVPSLKPQTQSLVQTVQFDDIVNEFKSLASRAGFDSSYIDNAVDDICSDTAKSEEDILKSILDKPNKEY